MGTSQKERVQTLIDRSGLSQAKFAESCGITAQSFCRAFNSSRGLSSQYLLRIASSTGANFEWLREGVGEMMANAVRKEKAEGEAQFAAFQTMMSGSHGSVVNNTIHGDHNTGTQTIQPVSNTEIELLKQKTELLEKIIEEKDKQIADKEAIIQLLRQSK